MAAGRNDPCPCGSGAKYKRCCLDRLESLTRLVAVVEERVDELGRAARASHPDEYATAFAEFYFGGEDAFGVAGPDPHERREADLWLVCDRYVGDRGTPLEVAIARTRGQPDPGLKLLVRSRLRAWRISSMRGAGLIDAVCPLTGQPALLETVRAPAGEVARGSFVVARSLPREDGTYALLGRAPVVDQRVLGEFEDLLGQLELEVTEPDQFWREHGGSLAGAAWSWPDEREHTREGEIVQEHFVHFALPDCEAMLRALDAATDIERTGQKFWDSDAIAWDWLVSSTIPPVEMPAEPGIEWFLCDEDAAEPSRLAKLEVNFDHAEVWLFAPSASRLERAEQEFVRRFAQLVGTLGGRGSDYPEIMPRWKRERHARIKAAVARMYRGDDHRVLAA